jgi:hypothetical protein
MRQSMNLRPALRWITLAVVAACSGDHTGPAGPPAIVVDSIVQLTTIFAHDDLAPVRLRVTNAGDGRLAIALVDEVRYDQAADRWLTATLSDSTTPATLTLQASVGYYHCCSPSYLIPGTYRAHVSLVSTTAGVVNTPRTIDVTLIVTAP